MNLFFIFTAFIKDTSWRKNNVYGILFLHVLKKSYFNFFFFFFAVTLRNMCTDSSSLSNYHKKTSQKWVLLPPNSLLYFWIGPNLCKKLRVRAKRRQVVVTVVASHSENYPHIEYVNWTYIKRSEDVLDVFWTCSIYVLCLRD